MMEQYRKFKSQTFNVQGQQYLYQIHLNSENSLIKVYNSDTLLRSTQRIRLPANCSAYPTQNYLVVLNQHQIQIYQIPNTTKKLKGLNPGIKQIKLICYNSQANLIFMVDNKNNLYYIMPQTDGIKIKNIYNCTQRGIKGNIKKLAVDYDTNVFLLSDQQVLYKLRFDWNKDDKFIEKTEQNQIIDVYSRFGWLGFISKSMNSDSEYELKINKYSNDQRVDEYVNNISAYKLLDEQPIIKATPNDFLYLNSHTKCLIAINNGEQIYETNINLPSRHNSNSDAFLFRIKKVGYNTLDFMLHYFQGLRQPFVSVRIPIKELNNMSQYQDIQMYVHNNIHLILNGNGLATHFQTKVRQYLGKQDDNHMMSDEKLACQFISKLLIKNPLTAQKLVNSFINSSKTNYLPVNLKRYLSYISYCLNDIVNQINGFTKAQQDNLNNRYQMLKIYLQNIINFAGTLYYVVKQAQTKFINSRSNQNPSNQVYDYFKMVEKCKVAYLLNQILYEHIIKTDAKIKITQSSVMMQERHKQRKDDIKVGKHACHEFFKQNISLKPGFHQVHDYLLECQNFYEAAYFYLFLDNAKEVIPYIGDNQTFQLIKFLVISPIHQVTNNREKMRKILKDLPKMTGKALLINEQSFLKYICSLSVNIQQQKCSLAILLSGASNSWPKTMQNFKFILQCLIVSDRVLLAYQMLLNQKQAAKYKQQQYKQMLVHQFVSTCIKEKKIKDLMQISHSSPYEEYIRKKLYENFGDDIKEISQLMSQLSS